MNYSDIQIVLQEVPGEISICFTITGCKIHCKGCHSPYLWKEGSGKKLSEDKFVEVLKKYKNLASAVLFMGGEWHKEELVDKLKIAKGFKYKTCLYTGENDVSDEIKKELTWLKTGKWVEELGGLNKEETNQKFIKVKTNEKLNNIFKN